MILDLGARSHTPGQTQTSGDSADDFMLWEQTNHVARGGQQSFDFLDFDAMAIIFAFLWVAQQQFLIVTARST